MRLRLGPREALVAVREKCAVQESKADERDVLVQQHKKGSNHPASKSEHRPHQGSRRIDLKSRRRPTEGMD